MGKKPDKDPLFPFEGDAPTQEIDVHGPLGQVLSTYASLWEQWGQWLSVVLYADERAIRNYPSDLWNALATVSHEAGPLDRQFRLVATRCRCELPQPRSDVVVELRDEIDRLAKQSQEWIYYKDEQTRECAWAAAVHLGNQMQKSFSEQLRTVATSIDHGRDPSAGSSSAWAPTADHDMIMEKLHGRSEPIKEEQLRILLSPDRFPGSLAYHLRDLKDHGYVWCPTKDGKHGGRRGVKLTDAGFRHIDQLLQGEAEDTD